MTKKDDLFKKLNKVKQNIPADKLIKIQHEIEKTLKSIPKTKKEKIIKHRVEELYLLPKIMIEESIDKLRKHADNCDLFSLSTELEFTSGFITSMSIRKEITEREHDNYIEEIHLIINRSEVLCKCTRI